jgi:hypothetical protein
MFVTNAEPPPAAICLCTMPQNEFSVEPFLTDLREAVGGAAPATAAGARTGQAAYGNV